MPEPVDTATATAATATRHLRWVNLVEGVSYALLVAVAMPLKYLGGEPAAVRVVGMIHGVLFVAFVAALARAALAGRWNVPRTASAFLWTLIPFAGALLLERRLRRDG